MEWCERWIKRIWILLYHKEAISLVVMPLVCLCLIKSHQIPTRPTPGIAWIFRWQSSCVKKNNWQQSPRPRFIPTRTNIWLAQRSVWRIAKMMQRWTKRTNGSVNWVYCEQLLSRNAFTVVCSNADTDKNAWLLWTSLRLALRRKFDHEGEHHWSHLSIRTKG